MIKLVWDTSALLAFKELSRERAYPPAYWLWKDIADGWITDSCTNIIPSISFFEFNHGISRKINEGKNILRNFFISSNDVIYPIDEFFIMKSRSLVSLQGFDSLKGTDLAIACIAKVENAKLITCDTDFNRVSHEIDLIPVKWHLGPFRISEPFPLVESRRSQGLTAFCCDRAPKFPPSPPALPLARRDRLR